MTADRRLTSHDVQHGYENLKTCWPSLTQDEILSLATGFHVVVINPSQREIRCDLPRSAAIVNAICREKKGSIF
jgi:hypothetical protein